MQGAAPRGAIRGRMVVVQARGSRTPLARCGSALRSSPLGRAARGLLVVVRVGLVAVRRLLREGRRVAISDGGEPPRRRRRAPRPHVRQYIREPERHAAIEAAGGRRGARAHPTQAAGRRRLGRLVLREAATELRRRDVQALRREERGGAGCGCRHPGAELVCSSQSAARRDSHPKAVSKRPKRTAWTLEPRELDEAARNTNLTLAPTKRVNPTRLHCLHMNWSYC